MQVESDVGFKVGYKVRIGSGEHAEERLLVGFGSLIFDHPLDYAHATGETVAMIKPTSDEKKVRCRVGCGYS